MSVSRIQVPAQQTIFWAQCFAGAGFDSVFSDAVCFIPNLEELIFQQQFWDCELAVRRDEFA